MIKPNSKILVVGSSGKLGSRLCNELEHLGCEVLKADMNENADYQFDISSWKSCQDLVQNISSQHPTIDALVNCSGVGVFKSFDSISPLEIQQMVDVNFVGSLYLTQAFLPAFKKNSSGRIIHVGSVSQDFVFENNSVYAATKAGLESFLRRLNLEISPHQIFCSLIKLGAVYSNIWKDRPEFKKEEMLEVSQFVDAVKYILAQPKNVRIDEIKVYPQKGVL